MTVRTWLSVVAMALTILGCAGATSPLGSQGGAVVVAQDGAEVVVPDGVDGSGITIALAAEPFRDPGMRAAGPGFVLGPSGASFPSPVTVRLPVDDAMLARSGAFIDDVRVYTRAAGEGRFHALATHVDANDRMVEAQVSHFSSFQAAVRVPTACRRGGEAEDCTGSTCGLAGLVEGFTEVSPGARESLALKATDACAAAEAQDLEGALALLVQLEGDLLALLGQGELDAFVYARLSAAVHWAEAALLEMPLVDATGTWLAPLPYRGGTRTIVVQLHQRADGSLMGYVPGSAGLVSVAGGRVHGRAIEVRLELDEGLGAAGYAMEGVMEEGAADDADVLSMTLQDGTDPMAVTWTRTTALLTERRFMLVDMATEGYSEVSVVETADGGLVSGSYWTERCEFLDCAGSVFDMIEEDSTGHLRLMVDSVNGAGSVEVDFASSEASDPLYRTYWGTWWFERAAGGRTEGQAFGGRAMGTNTKDARAMLDVYGWLADDLAHGANFLHTGYGPVLPGYLHFGSTADALKSELAAEVNLFGGIAAEFTRFRNLATLPEGERLNELGVSAMGVDFHDRRTGTHAGQRLVYRNENSDPPHDALRFLERTAGSPALAIAGNRTPVDGIELPFAPTDLADVTDGGFHPFGVHTTWQEAGTDGFGFRFPGTEQKPVHAPMASDVVVLIGSESFFGQCTAGEEYEVILRGNGYTAGTFLTGCTFEGLPERVEKGLPIGFTPFEGGSWPTYRSSLATDLRYGRTFCPYWVLSPTARAQVLVSANATGYREELTEPFICNPGFGQSDVFPITLTWTLSGGAGGPDVPASVSFTRTSAEADWNRPYEYAFLSAEGESLETGFVSLFDFLPWGEAAVERMTLSPDGGTPREVVFRIENTGPVTAVLFLNPVNNATDGMHEYHAGVDAVRVGCNDGNLCTDDVPVGDGCEHVPNALACDDGDPCTAGDQCAAGTCAGWAALDCDDGNVCTTDSCEPASGCVHADNAVPCADDGNACTDDVCAGGAWPTRTTRLRARTGTPARPVTRARTAPARPGRRWAATTATRAPSTRASPRPVAPTRRLPARATTTTPAPRTTPARTRSAPAPRWSATTTTRAASTRAKPEPASTGATPTSPRARASAWTTRSSSWTPQRRPDSPRPSGSGGTSPAPAPATSKSRSRPGSWSAGRTVSIP